MAKSIIDIRWDNFDKLFEAFKAELWRKFPDEPEKGMVRKFSVAANLSERYASHLKCRRKPIGHAVARKIEVALGVPVAWMDQDHGELSASAIGTVSAPAVGASGEVLPPALADYLDMATEMFKQQPEEAQAAMMSLVLKTLRKKGSNQ